jgi:hypothetical protein
MVAQGVDYSRRMGNQVESDAVPGDRARREHGLPLSRIVFCFNATLVLTLVFGKCLTGSVSSNYSREGAYSGRVIGTLSGNK